MVARRRLKRAVHHSRPPPRHKHVSLAEATIEKVGQGSAEKQVEEMRKEIAEEEQSRQKSSSADSSQYHKELKSPTDESSPVPDTESDSDDTDEGIKAPGKWWDVCSIWSNVKANNYGYVTGF